MIKFRLEITVKKFRVEIAEQKQSIPHIFKVYKCIFNHFFFHTLFTFHEYF